MTDNRQGLLMETLLEMTASSMARAGLTDRELMLVRLAALIAMDAPAASYLANLPMSAEAGLSIGLAQGVLIAVAPVVGAPRVTAAAGSMASALGLALAIGQPDDEDADDDAEG
jgi:hypothetical protein